MHLFHITTRDAWTRAQADGVYTAASLAAEGFIHLSGADQWCATMGRHFTGQRDLVLLSIQPDLLTAEVKWEQGVPPTPNGERFPHLYGPLPLAAVVEVLALPDLGPAS